MRRSSRLLPLAILLAACATDSPIAPEGTFPIVTDRTSYTVTTGENFYESEIRFTYTNHGSSPVWYHTCGGFPDMDLEKRVEGEWVYAWGIGTFLCGGFPRPTIRPGFSLNLTFVIEAGRPGTNNANQFAVDEIPGEYRLDWPLLAREEGDLAHEEDLVPVEERISNSFTLTLAE